MLSYFNYHPSKLIKIKLNKKKITNAPLFHKKKILLTIISYNGRHNVARLINIAKLKLKKNIEILLERH